MPNFLFYSAVTISLSFSKENFVAEPDSYETLHLLEKVSRVSKHFPNFCLILCLIIGVIIGSSEVETLGET